MLCDTGSSNVQKSPIWGLGSVGGNVDEVEISTASITQCPAHSDIHRSTDRSTKNSNMFIEAVVYDISRKVNTGEGRDRGGTWRIMHQKYKYPDIFTEINT